MGYGCFAVSYQFPSFHAPLLQHHAVLQPAEFFGEIIALNSDSVESLHTFASSPLTTYILVFCSRILINYTCGKRAAEDKRAAVLINELQMHIIIFNTSQGWKMS